MKDKLCKTLIVFILIITLAGLDVIFLGNQAILALYDRLEQQETSTNIKNVLFDAYFKETETKKHSKEALISTGDNLILDINIQEAGVLEDGKIKIENANFKLQPTQNQYIKNINTDTNEIELNQMIAGNQVEISVPITFEKVESMNKEYLSQETKVKLVGTYQKNENEKKEIIGEKNVSISWKEEEEILLKQEVEKYIDLENDRTLIQQKITSQIINNTLVQEKRAEITVPEIKNTLPETIDILINQEKISQEKYTYDKENKTITIQNTETNNQEKDEYQIIYHYPINIQGETLPITLKSKMQVSLYTDEVLEKEDVREVETKKIDNRISVRNEATGSMYKGYLYAGLNRDTSYQEKMAIEISTLEGANEIEINQMQDYFINQEGNRNSVNGSTYIRKLRLSRRNLEAVLGTDFSVGVIGENEQVLGEVNKESAWNEDDKIEISLEEKSLQSIRMVCNQPTEIGTLIIEMDKYIKGETGYSKPQLKTFTQLENTKIIAIGEKKIPVNSIVTLEDTCTEARIEVNSTNFSTFNKNENIQINAILKSDSEKYDLYQNPYVEIKFPEELKEINVHSINLLYGDGLNITRAIYEPEAKAIQIQIEGKQNDFKTTLEEGIQIVISADLTFQKDTPNKETAITMSCQNENVNESQYQTNVNVTLNSKYGAILYSNVSGYNEENTVIESTEEKVMRGQLDLDGQEQQATISQSFINNYETPIDQITMIGSLARESSEEENELGSNFETALVQGITTSSENTKVYYSVQKNVSAEDDSWQENVENLQDVKSYKIEVAEELQPSETMNITYQLHIPAQLQAGSQTYQQTEVSYSYNGQPLNTSSTILLATEETQTANVTEEAQAENVTGEIQAKGKIEEINGIKTEIVAMSANKELADGEEIFEGQPVSYTVKVTNNTGADLNNLQLIAEHTNVVYYVEKEREAEVTDSEVPEIMIRTEKDEKAPNITKTLQTLKSGETTTFTYQFSPKRKDGNEILGKITIKADNREAQQVNTITNTIKNAKIAIEVINYMDENLIPFEKDVISFKFNVSNYTNEEQKNVVLKIQASDLLTCMDEVELIKEDLGFETNYEDGILVLTIPTLEANQTKSFNLTFAFGTIPDNKVISSATIYYTAQLDNDTYFSNTLIRQVKRNTARVTAIQSTDIKGTVRVGDRMIYTAEITNTDSILEAEDMEISHEVTEGNAKIEKAYVIDGNDKTIDAIINGTNEATVNCSLQPGETIRYIAEVLIWDNPDEDVNYEDTVISYISLAWGVEGTLDLNEITNDLYDENEEIDDDDDDEDEPGEQPGEQPGQTKTYSISGIAWLDSNKDGTKDDSENGMKDLEVSLMNTQTGEKIKNSKTNETGYYQFDSLEEGNYIVIFNYDSSLYSITQYKKEGVEEAKNSNVIQKEIEGKVAAMTDTLAITNQNLSNINAGFTQNAKFDFSLDKSINKVIVQNATGTKQIGYNKAKLAKVEIDSKYMANTLVLVEYSIEVRNEGEIQGYVNEIIDYMPKDLKFSSEINKDWYIGTDGNIHNISLANTVIKPGESIQLTLTLTKQMTTENTGTSVNIAEIAGATNELSIADVDSTPGKRKDGEDDISTAELVISVKTGMVAISVSMIVVFTLIAVAYVIYRKKKGEK